MSVAVEADAPQAHRDPTLAASCATPVLALSARLPFYLLIGVIFVYALFPFYWALKSAFTPEDDALPHPGPVHPSRPDARELPRRAENGNFQYALLNSTIVAASVTLFALAIGSLAAYALGRFRFRGRTATLYLMLSMTIFPQIAILGALYTMINRARALRQPRGADLQLHGPHAPVHGLDHHELHARAYRGISRRRRTSTAPRRCRPSTG